MGLLDRLTAPKIRVHLLIRGRIGEGWRDVDETLKLPEGATLGDFVEHCARKGIPLEEALKSSPHLAETLMLNGGRCPVEANLDRPLADGDEIYLLAPLAGG